MYRSVNYIPRLKKEGEKKRTCATWCVRVMRVMCEWTEEGEG